MNKIICFLALLMILVSACKKKESGGGSSIITPTKGTASVLTQHNDNTRAGLNSNETVLTTSNVNTTSFGKQFTLSVDDQIYAQPLVVANLSISSGTHNVVFIATVNNTIYAFDGDNGKLYWTKNFTVAGLRPPNAGDMSSSWCTPYTDIAYNIGIIGTPVIDSVKQLMFFVSRSTNGVAFHQYLHSVSLLNGADQPGSPIEIAAKIAGTGDGSVNDSVSFDPFRNNQRQGLTLVNGVVYVTWSSHCDMNPYHGWIIGYDEQTLTQETVYNDTPTGENGGIWESGMGMAADAQGNLYITTGNGTVGEGGLYTETGNGTGESVANPEPTNLTNRGESALKLTPSGSTLSISSYFTPTNYVNLNVNDLDYGVMGTFLIPNSQYYFTGCKDGNLYLLNTGNMGGYSSSSNQVQQTVAVSSNLHCQPAYYNGTSNEYVYVWGENDVLRALTFNRTTNTFNSTQTTSGLSGPTGGCGAEISVSSNGNNDSTGIVWITYAYSGDAGNTTSPGILRALPANNITKELWDSNIAGGDAVGNFSKFCSPTIANGHVYLATFSMQVDVYGLK